MTLRCTSRRALRGCACRCNSSARRARWAWCPRSPPSTRCGPLQHLCMAAIAVHASVCLQESVLLSCGCHGSLILHACAPAAEHTLSVGSARQLAVVCLLYAVRCV
jgi:hypothetical protein